MQPKPFVSIQNVAKRWNGQLGVEGITLDIEEGSFVALLGPSGCGKSTSLRLVAGLEIADEGQIFIQGKDVTNSASSDRNLSMVFQSYALFPHLSVAENVIFGLKVRRVSKAERESKMRKALEITGLLGSKSASLQNYLGATAACCFSQSNCCRSTSLSNGRASIKFRCKAPKLCKKRHKKIAERSRDYGSLCNP